MNRLDGADAPYWVGLSEGLLLLPRCAGCNHWVWPAGHRCSRCSATGLRWEERQLRARVYSWTRTWHRFGLTESLDLPFTSVLAEVEDCGIRLLGRLEDPDRIDPEPGEALAGAIGTSTVGDDSIPTIVWRRAA